MERKIRKKALLYGIAAILMASVLGTLIYNYGAFITEYVPTAPPIAVPSLSFLSTFQSKEALKNFLETSAGTQGPIWFYGAADANNMRVFFNAPEAATSSSKEFAFQQSETNVQVAGVDEADIVKIDDQGYMYVLADKTIYILRAYPPALAEIVATITLSNLYPIGIFVSGDRLAVLASRYTTTSEAYYRYYIPDIKTVVNIYDVGDRAHPALLRDLTLTGSYFNSRMIGDYIYFVTSAQAYVANDTVYLPEISSNGQNKTIEPTEIRYCNGTDDYYLYTTFVAMNMQNSAEAPVYLPIMLGSAGNMYVSLTNMYITFRNWIWGSDTTIYRIRIQASNMTCEAKGTVPGHERNQFSMDEYNGYFRIETTTWTNTTETNLYVLDMNLTTVGRLEGLAPGENFHSARFMGDRAYFVTFQSVDPLFVIDLSSPTNPTVLGELKIPGYSDYLHPYDETHIIGVGKHTVEADQGYFAWYQGIKISLFDVSDVTNPVQMWNVIIGERGSDSYVLEDHKAFLFDISRNLLALPIKEAQIDRAQYPYGIPPSAYGQPVWQGAYVYHLSLEQGFALKGRVTHLEPGMDIATEPTESYWVKRSLYIEDVFYTVSSKKIKFNYLEDLEPIMEIPLS